MLKAVKEEEKFKDSHILEGMVSVSAVIKARESGENTRKIERVLYDGARAKSKAREIAFLRKKSAEHGFTLAESNAEQIDSMTIGNTHGGIIALCSEREFQKITKDYIKPNGFYVMLEGIEDPYNFGYALRSIYAAGADGILLSERNWMSAAGVVARASAGASELCDVRIGDPLEIIGLFKECGYSVYAADKTEGSVSVYDTDVSFPCLLLVGGEKRGLTRIALDNSDKIIHLDYGRDFPAALSAASAASIIAFEIFRQNRRKQ